jgi:hypothetical protein
LPLARSNEGRSDEGGFLEKGALLKYVMVRGKGRYGSEGVGSLYLL